jgi:hypothetical protein
MKHITVFVQHFGTQRIRRTLWQFLKWRKCHANIYVDCVKKCWRSDNMKASDEILGIAEQIFIDINDGRDLNDLILPVGWEISQINTANKTMTLLIPTDFDTIDTKSKEKEIPFTRWIYLLFLSMLKDLKLFIKKDIS